MVNRIIHIFTLVLVVNLFLFACKKKQEPVQGPPCKDFKYPLQASKHLIMKDLKEAIPPLIKALHEHASDTEKDGFGRGMRALQLGNTGSLHHWLKQWGQRNLEDPAQKKRFGKRLKCTLNRLKQFTPAKNRRKK